MKHKLFALLFAIIASVSLFAQDVIITNGSNRIEAKILEVSDKEIKYQEADFPDGPIFVLATSKIYSITYSNGKVVMYDEDDIDDEESSKQGRIIVEDFHYVQDGQYLSSGDVSRILEAENSAAYSYWQTANGYLAGAIVSTCVGGGLLLGSIYPFTKKKYGLAVGLDVGGAIIGGLAIGLAFGATRYYTKAINLYNSSYDNVAVQLKWQIAPNGVGLAFVF